MAVFKPTGTLHRVTDITPELLGAMHIRALVLDVDNTMAPHGDQTPYTGVLEWTKRMTAAGVRLVVVSNNYKKRVAPFAAQFSLPYVSFACKPSPFGYLRAKRLSGARVRECLVVGDQIFTDILGANLCCAACPRCFWIPSRATRPRRCASSAGSSISSGRIISGWIQKSAALKFKGPENAAA